MFDWSKLLPGMGKTREELLLALDTNTGDPLIPEDLEKILVDLVKWNAPFTRTVEVIRANGLIHQFNQITGIPTSQFEGENAETVITNSGYNRDGVTLKVIRTKGRVTGLLQAASAKYINAWKQELINSTKSMGRTIEFAMLWGNATADGYQYDGADTAIQSYRYDINAVADLADLDMALDGAYNEGAQMDPYVFVMSPNMVSRMSTLQTEIRKSVPLDTIEFPGGFRMTTYRDVPMLPSSFCRPTSQMGTLALTSAANTGGLMTPGEVYRYRVSAVTYFGEQCASASASPVTILATHNSVEIDFTAVANAQLYKVYRSPDAGGVDTEVLLSTWAAKTYDADGTVTGAITQIIDLLDDSSLGTDYPMNPEVAGTRGVDETIFLINISPQQSLVIAGLINPQGEKVNNLVQHIPLAVTRDAMEFLLTSYHAPAWKGEKFSAVLRRARTY